MSDKVYLGPRVSNLDTGELTERVSRVNLLVDSQNMYTAGDDSGRTIEKTCPWGTQAMANSILAQLRKVDYRPYSGLDGLLDPAAEVGDGITVGDTYSVLAQTDIQFDALCSVDVSAPGGDEVEDEYPYKSRARRQSDRNLARVYSSITKTAERIELLVANEVEGLEGKITLTATSLTTQINNTRDGLNSKIEQTASSLTTEINNTKTVLSSKIEQTASSLTTEINNTKEGLSSRIEQTASSLSTQISNAQRDISSLQQTASSLSFTASAQGGEISSLWDAVKGFRLEVSNGSDSSTLTLMSGWTEISSAEIVLRGAVTVEDLSGEGRTVINGSNITTGIINAAVVGVSGMFTVYNGRQAYGFMGCGQGRDDNGVTYGAMLACADGGNYVIATSGGVRMQDRNGGAIMVAGGNCAATTEISVVSDRRMKKDIQYDMARYRTFFRALRPCRFHMADKADRCYHTGFIAQEVEDALKTSGLGPEDFDGLVKFHLPGGGERYFLRYGAFPALNTYMIQDLERRVAVLEAMIVKETTT